MNENKMTSKTLSYMKLAYEVQKIARPYIKQGGYSLSSIYFNHVIEEVPICMNTFRKMLKEDVEDFPQLAKAYKEEKQERYLKHLQQLTKKRMEKITIRSKHNICILTKTYSDLCFQTRF